MAKRWALLGLLGSGACGLGGPALVSMSCSTVPHPGGNVPVEATDPLLVILHVDSLEGGREGQLLVRVDPLMESATIQFAEPPPPTTAAVSATATLAAVFQGCLDPAPWGIRLRAASAPRGKLWMKVASERSVHLQVETGEPGPEAVRVSDVLVIEPGTSSRGIWRLDSP